MAKHLNIHAYGKVQGVFYRHAAREKATLLGLKGYIQNQEDNSIYAEVEGENSATDEFAVWAKSGPQLAEVQKVDVQEGPIQNYTEFQIK